MTERVRLSPAAALRDAIRDWAELVCAPVVPSLKVIPSPQGEVNRTEVCGIRWPAATIFGQRPRPIHAYEDGRALWLVHIEEVAGALTFRLGPEQAEALAYEFIARANVEAAKRDPWGSRTTTIPLKFGDYGDQSARLYLEGVVEAVPPDRAQQRNEWIIQAPFIVTYPVLWAEGFEDKSGRMSIVVDLNGTIFTAPIGAEQ